MDVAVGGTGVRVNVGEGTGVGVGGGVRGIQAANKTKSTMQYTERGISVSLENGFTHEPCEDQALPALM